MRGQNTHDHEQRLWDEERRLKGMRESAMVGRESVRPGQLVGVDTERGATSLRYGRSGNRHMFDIELRIINTRDTAQD